MKREIKKGRVVYSWSSTKLINNAPLSTLNCWSRLKSENLEHNTKYFLSVSTQNLLEELRLEKEKIQREVKQFVTKTNDLEQQLREREEKLQLVVEFTTIDAKQQKSYSSEEGQ